MSQFNTNRGWLRSAAALAFVAGFAVSAQAGECPADKSQAERAPGGRFQAGRRHRHDARRDRPRQGDGEDQGPRTALPQDGDPARRHRAMAQPRRPSGTDLRRRGRDHRIRQQLRGARSITRPARFARKHKARRTGGRTSATSPWSCSSVTSATTRTTTICDGCASPTSVAFGAPFPRTGRHIFICGPSSGRQFIEHGYRKTAEIYGFSGGSSLITCVVRAVSEGRPQCPQKSSSKI